VSTTEGVRRTQLRTGLLLLMADPEGARRRLQPVLDLTTSLAAASIAGASGAGVSLIDEAGAKTSTASTHPLVAAADDQQYEIGEGPCLTAWADSVLVRVDDLIADPRWPQWREAARTLHLRSVLSAPIVTPTRTVGALKVYSDEPNVFDRVAEHLLLQLAQQAALLIDNVQSLTAAKDFSETIKEGLRTRQTIAVAAGVLMERHQINKEQAFLQLRDSALRNNRTVVDEAAEILAGR
jgi:GAF domain-containing protein